MSVLISFEISDVEGGLDWGALENAIRQWILATGLVTTEKVILAGQDGPRPAVPFFEVRLGDMEAVGAADARSEDYDSGAPAGQEITETVRGMREFPVFIRCFTTSAVGSSSARALLSQVQTALGLPDVRDIIRAAGMTCWDTGRVQTLPAVLDTKWEGRATLTVRMYAEEHAIQKTGYIDTVEVTDEGPTPDDVFTIP